MDGPERGAVLKVVALSLCQHALVDPLKVVNINSEGEGDARQQPQCQLLGIFAEVRQGRS